MDDRYQHKWRALIGISLLSFVGFTDFAIVVTVLPGIQADLLASVKQLQWVMNIFIIMLAMFMVTMGRVGDILGRRRVLYVGVVVFAAASALAGTADSAGFLIFCRGLQGISAAITFTCAASLLTFAFPADEQGRALGIFMSITAFGMAIGPVLGGIFMSLLSWRWAFYVNVPVAIIGFLICRGAVQETPRQAGERIDWWGLAFLVPGIGCLVLAIMEGNDWGWTSPIVLALFAVALVCLIGILIVEPRVATPIIDLKLFRQPMFVHGILAGIGVGGFIGLGMFLPPLYLMNIQGVEPYVAGLMLLPITGLVMILPPLVGKWVDKNGPVLVILVGQAILVIAALAQSQFTAVSPAWFVLVGLGLFGLGWGVQQASTASAVTSALPTEAAGLAIGSLWTFWNIGSSLTLAIGVMILRLVEHAKLNALLAEHKIALSESEQHVIRSLLTDPSRAKEALGDLPANLTTEIVPLFHESFMDGFADAMLFLAAFCALTMIGATLAALRVRKAND